MSPVKRIKPQDINENYKEWCARLGVWDAIYAQWDRSDPSSPDPATLNRNSTEEVSWVCKRGHRWKESPLKRGRRKRCKECKPAERRNPKDINDNYKEYCQKLGAWDAIYSQWDSSDQSSPDPATLRRNSAEKVSWVCEHGHKWAESPLERGKRKRCPICKVATMKFVADERPELRPMYSPKNYIPFDSLTSGFMNDVIWVCPEGHEFLKSPARMVRSQACPICTKKQREIPASESLFVTHPYLKEYWDFEANEGRHDPDMLTADSHVKVFWKCPHGHKSKATIFQKAHADPERLCSYCSGKRCAPEKSLAVLYPELAKQIIEEGYQDKIENGEVVRGKIWRVSPANKSLVLWKCPKCGGIFLCRISYRVKWPRCRLCEKGSKPKTKKNGVQSQDNE